MDSPLLKVRTVCPNIERRVIETQEFEGLTTSQQTVKVKVLQDVGASTGLLCECELTVFSVSQVEGVVHRSRCRLPSSIYYHSHLLCRSFLCRSKL